jgi:hypothetical protein
MPDTLGPVELEFSIPDDFEKDIDSAIKKMAGLTGAASKLPADVKAAMVEQSAVVKAIEADVKALEKSLNSVAPGKAKQELIQEVSAAKRALAEEKASLQGLTTSYDQSKDSSKRLTIQLRDMQDQLAKLRIAGKQNTDEYKLMEGAAAKLADELRDVRSVTKNIGDDQATFKGFADGITGLTGAFAAGGGAVALFAGENENLQKIQTKVQGLMAITIGLQQVSTALNKDSAFMTITVVKAKQGWLAVEKGLTSALWGSNIAAKALMGTLTLGIAVAIPYLIGLFDSWNQKQKEAAKAQQEVAKAQASAAIEAGKSRMELQLLISKLESFRGSKEAEKRMIDEVNKKYGDTFGSYKTLADWLDILKSKAADYIEIMFLQAKMSGSVANAQKFDSQAKTYETMRPDEFSTGFEEFMGYSMDGRTIQTAAADRQKIAIKNAEKWRDNELKEAEKFQKEIEAIQNRSKINVFADPEKPGEKKTEKTYAQKLAEIKKFYELYKKAIELGQAEAAAIFRAQLPDASTFQGYVDSEISKASKEGNQEKLSALLPEQEQFRAGLNELLGEFKTYQEQRAAIEKEYNEKIWLFTKAGYTEKAKVAAEARDKELQELDESQPLNKLIDKYRDYRGQIVKITEDSQKEIDALRAAGNENEAIEAELRRDQEIGKLILDNEFKQYEKIEEMGRKELQAFMLKIKTKIELLKAEGKNVELLEQVYNKAQKALSGGDGAANKFKNVADIFGSITQAAGLMNDELGRMVGLAANLASNMSGALESMKKGGAEAISGFGTIVSIVATIADELDKQWGRQARIADLEQKRIANNNRLRNVIDNTTDALERQLKALDRISGAEKPEAYNETLDFLRAKIESTQAAIDTFKFDFLPGPDDLDQTIDLAFIKFATKAETEAEAIRIALADGIISREQADIALEYIRTLEQLSDQAYEMSQQRIEFLTQTNSIDLANELADTIVNAFNEGESAAMAWGMVTDQVMANAIKSALKMKLLSGPINDAVAALADDMEDGALSVSEQNAFRDKLDAAAENFNAALAAYPDLFGTETAAALAEPNRNMFSGMTQQTGSELLGQFTALRMSSARVADILADERNARAAMRQTLEIIAENTYYCRKLDNIDRTLTTLETDGIKVR